MDRKKKTVRRPVSNLTSLMERMKQNEAAPVNEVRRAAAGEGVQERRDDLDELRELTQDPLEEYRNRPSTKELEMVRKIEAEG